MDREYNISRGCCDKEKICIAAISIVAAISVIAVVVLLFSDGDFSEADDIVYGELVIAPEEFIPPIATVEGRSGLLRPEGLR